MTTSIRTHLEFLSLLHAVWGVFGLLCGASLAILAAGSLTALLDLGSLGAAERAGVWLLAGCGVVLMAAGATSLVVGRLLPGRRTRTRHAALGLAVTNLVIVPFGTALAVYTFWVLMNDDARLEFDGRTRTPTPPLTPVEGA